MPQFNHITIALRPHEGETLDGLRFYARLGAPVSVGRALGIIASISEGDAVERALESEAQIVLAEAALKRSTASSGGENQITLRQLMDHVPALYIQVADEIKLQALGNGNDEEAANEAADQAIKVLLAFKQRLEQLLKESKS